MPSHEPIVSTLLPKEVEKPIPVRTVVTRSLRLNQNQDQQAKVDSRPAESPGSPVESVKLSGQVSAIARKEQAFRQRELEFKNKEREFEEKLKKADAFEKLQSKLGAKDYSEAESLGLNYEDYVKYKLEKGGEIDPRDQKVQTLEEKLQAMEKKQEESIERQYEETVAEYRSEIAKAVADDPKFSKVKKMQATEHVLQLILDTFEEDGTSLPVDKACEQIESFLTEEKRKWDLLNEPEPLEVPKVIPRPTRTLTNDMAAGASSSRPQKSLQHLSDEERWAEARRRAVERRQQQGR